jgi:hypothetical protein
MTDLVDYSTVNGRWGGKEALECDIGMLKRARAYEAEALGSLHPGQ